MILDEYLSVDSADLSINEYFSYGGLPEVYQYSGEEREEYLNGILETYIQRDIKSLVKEENISSFNKLLYMLAQNQAQVIAVNNLANDLAVIMESYAYHYLLFIANKANTDIFFWRTSKGQEVDFIWQKNKVLVPIEVKYKYESGALPSGMEAFFRAYPLTQEAVILFNSSRSFDNYQMLDYKGRKIHMVKITESHNYLDQILNQQA